MSEDVEGGGGECEASHTRKEDATNRRFPFFTFEGYRASTNLTNSDPRGTNERVLVLEKEER